MLTNPGDGNKKVAEEMVMPVQAKLIDVQEFINERKLSRLQMTLLRTADGKAPCERSDDQKSIRLGCFVPHVRDFFFRRSFTFGSIFRTKLPLGDLVL
jgi:hypothetical protein